MAFYRKKLQVLEPSAICDHHGKPLPRSVLVVGSGGREHALVRALAASPAQAARDLRAGQRRHRGGSALLSRRGRRYRRARGPGAARESGIRRRRTRSSARARPGRRAARSAGIPAYGPKADGARLEASKIFTKEILLKYQIPTAAAGFSASRRRRSPSLRSRPAPIVVKADGLAAGKGVVVAQTHAEAEEAVRDHARRQIRRQRQPDPDRGLPVRRGNVPARRRLGPRLRHPARPRRITNAIGDGDTGPNTGGMGTYSPAEVVTPALLAGSNAKSSGPRSTPSRTKASIFAARSSSASC